MRTQTTNQRIVLNHEMVETRKEMTPVRLQADREGGGKIRRGKMGTSLAAKFSLLAAKIGHFLAVSTMAMVLLGSIEIASADYPTTIDDTSDFCKSMNERLGLP